MPANNSWQKEAKIYCFLCCRYVLQKINGWKIYHLAAGMEDIVDMESELSKRLQEVTSGSFWWWFWWWRGWGGLALLMGILIGKTLNVWFPLFVCFPLVCMFPLFVCFYVRKLLPLNKNPFPPTLFVTLQCHLQLYIVDGDIAVGDGRLGLKNTNEHWN